MRCHLVPALLLAISKEKWQSQDYRNKNKDKNCYEAAWDQSLLLSLDKQPTGLTTKEAKMSESALGTQDLDPCSSIFLSLPLPITTILRKPF